MESNSKSEKTKYAYLMWEGKPRLAEIISSPSIAPGTTHVVLLVPLVGRTKRVSLLMKAFVKRCADASVDFPLTKPGP